MSILKIASFSIQLQIVLSLAIFIFSKPLQIDRSVLTQVQTEKRVIQDGVDKSRDISLIDKFKLLLKPKYNQPEIRDIKVENLFKSNLHSVEVNFSILKPPKIYLLNS